MSHIYAIITPVGKKYKKGASIMSENYFEEEFENEFEDECKCGNCKDDSLCSILENKYVRIGLLAIGLLVIIGIIIWLSSKNK